jgi:hypothetical protein
MENGTGAPGGASMDPRDEVTEHLVRAELKWLTERAKAKLVEQGCFSPIVLVVCTVSPFDGVTPMRGREACVPVIVAGEDFDDAMKQEMVSKARALAVAGRAIAAITCVDADIVVGEENVRKLTGRPSEAVDGRRDAVVTVVEWNTGRSEAAIVPYTKDQGFVDFDDDIGGEGDHCGGLMTIMPPPTANIPDEMRAAARAFVSAFLMNARDLQVMQGKQVGNA